MEKLEIDILTEFDEKGIKNANKALNELDGTIKALEKSTSKSIQGMKIQLQSYQRIAEKTTDPKVLSEYNGKIQNLEKSISQATNVGKSGFDAMGNAIEKTSGNIAGKLYSGLRVAAQILPGVGIAGILAFATEPIIKYISELDLFNAKVSEAVLAKKELDAASLKGAQSAQDELTDLKLLYAQYQNTNLTLAQRKDGYEQLQALYPEYFGNLKFEEKAGKDTAAAYNTLTKSILATAKARAAADKIAENSSRILEDEQRIVDLQKQLTKSKSTDTGYAAALGGSAETRDIEKQINDLAKDREILNGRNLRLSKNITAEIEKGARITDAQLKDPKIKTAAKIKAPELEFPNTPEQDAKNFREYMGKLGGLKNLELKVPKLNLQLPPPVKIETGDLVDFEQAELEAKIARINESFETLAQGILQSGVADAFAVVGTSIGESLATGANIIQALGLGLLGILGGILTQLGKAAIAVGVGMQAIKAAFKNPFTAIAAGVALIALGSFISKKVANITQGDTSAKTSAPAPIRAFANGGIISGPTLGLMGEYAGARSNPEVVAPLNKLKGLISGSSNSEVFIPDMRLRGEDIVVAFNRASKRKA